MAMLETAETPKNEYAVWFLILQWWDRLAAMLRFGATMRSARHLIGRAAIPIGERDSGATTPNKTGWHSQSEHGRNTAATVLFHIVITGHRLWRWEVSKPTCQCARTGQQIVTTLQRRAARLRGPC